MAVNYELRSVENGATATLEDGTTRLQVVVSVGIVGDVYFPPIYNYSQGIIILPTDTVATMQANMGAVAEAFLIANYINVP